jgi:hypothetical protein
MTDVQRLDPALLTEGERDEIPELDDLLLGEVRAHPAHERFVNPGRVPHQVARVEQGRLLALVEAIRAFEFEQLVEVLFRGRLLSSRESPLRSSVVAIDRL